MIRLVTKLCYQDAAIRGNSVKYSFKYACSKYALYLSAYRSNGGQVTFKNFKYGSPKSTSKLDMTDCSSKVCGEPVCPLIL